MMIIMRIIFLNLLERNTHNSDDFIDFLKLLDGRYAIGNGERVCREISDLLERY